MFAHVDANVVDSQCFPAMYSAHSGVLVIVKIHHKDDVFTMTSISIQAEAGM